MPSPSQRLDHRSMYDARNPGNKENRSPNIGELKVSKRRDLIRQHQQKSTAKSEDQLQIPSGAKSKSVSKVCDGHTKNKTVGPLSCRRDPLRVPLQSHLPFTTNAHQGRKIYFDDSDSSLSMSTNVHDKVNGAQKVIEQRKLGDLEGSKYNRMTPAYAYRNLKTDLLEIATKPPVGDIELVAQPLPIAVNAGGVGLYTGSDFALGGLNSLSHNRHETNWGATNPVIEFPWNLGESTFSGEKQKRSKDECRSSPNSCRIQRKFSNDSLDIETGLSGKEHSSPDGSNGSREATTNNNPWKIWERHLNKVKSVDMLGSFGERNIRQLPNLQKSKSVRQSGFYNEDHFDYTIVLQPLREYAECAATLDFSNEREQSIFDRALEELSPTKISAKTKRKSSQKSPLHQTVGKIRKSIGKFTPYRVKHSHANPTPPSRGRKWGSELMSPPVKSHRKKSPKRSKGVLSSSFVRNETKDLQQKNLDETNNPNVLQVGEIPNPRIPRGMARKHGLEEFLWALEQGIIVRRHRAFHDPVFLKLYSNNRGDTIHYEYVTPEDAVTALKCQIQRYGGQNLRGIGDKEVKRRISAWAPDCQDGEKANNESQKRLEQFNASLSEYDGRRSSVGGLIDSITTYATKAVHSGYFKADHLVHVQRATHPDCLTRPDPYSEPTEVGSHTIRECKDNLKRSYLKELDILKRTIMEDEDNDISEDKRMKLESERVKLENKFMQKWPQETRTFSIIVPSLIQRFSSLKEANEAWFSGKASFKNFSFLDLETATDGEYWMLFRGFLLLNRDAVNGWFAKDRSSGFGSNYKPLVGKEKSNVKNKGISDASKSQSNIFRALCGRKNKRNLDTQSSEMTFRRKTIPPPDFYLGESPGTQIWARLRLAGLETERIFDLDTKNVMIKLRCPTERLIDVAEVLQLKLKTVDGGYAPFKESMIDIFQPTDALDGGTQREWSIGASIFQSSIRQQVIDFIINSQIRDTGAGLSARYALAKKGIKKRSPLHMHARLEMLFNIWYYFSDHNTWKCIEKENEFHAGRNGEKISSMTSGDDEVPPFLNRFLVGMFYLPLDSIEQYYGEKVAFYFAWLQHSSIKMIFPSFLGVIVVLYQSLTKRWENNEILPVFSFIVMVWSFYVMITWKQWQNDLTHRWGSMNYHQDETPRPQFYGKYEICEIENRAVVTYPAWKRWIKYCISFPITVIFTIIAFLGIIMVYTNRDNMMAKYFGDPHQNVSQLFDLTWNVSIIGKTDAIVAVDLSPEHLKNPKFWWTVGLFPCLIGLGLPLLNFLLMRLSRMLNDLENHKTETHYRNALIAKVIAFRFVAYFAALYYYASVAAIGAIQGSNERVVKNAFLRIATSLVIYLTVQHWWSLFLQIYVPLKGLRYYKDSREMKLKAEMRDLEKKKQTYRQDQTLNETQLNELRQDIANKEVLLKQGSSAVWEEMVLPDYDPFFDYVQSVIYFAYVTCFSAIFPLTPLLVLINQLVNMRMHAYKICRVRRRPLAQKTGGIAVWEHVLHVVTMIGIVTNTSLMILTNSLFDFIRENSADHKHVALLGAFVIWERIMVTIKYILQFTMPDKSSKLIRKLKEEEHKKNEKLREEVMDRNLKNNRRKSSTGTVSIRSIGIHSDLYKSTASREDVRKNSVFKGIPDKGQESTELSPLASHRISDKRYHEKENRSLKRHNRQKSQKHKTSYPANTPVFSKKSGPAVKARSTKNSPFSHFLPNGDDRSPLVSNTVEDYDEESQNLSEMLSLENNVHGTDDKDEYRTPLKPSMQRSIKTRHQQQELDAAQQRIRSRLSVTNRSDRKKK